MFFKKHFLSAAGTLALLFSANASAGYIHDFDINVNFTGGLTASQQGVFTQAENLWETLIIGYQNELVLPGLTIDAAGTTIDGQGGILGQAGPTHGYFMPENVYASAGIMQFDSADLFALESTGRLFDVIAHEMAHVMGFGTLWADIYNDVLDLNGNYIGEHGLAAYRFEIGDPTAAYIPVEQGGGAGTAGSHWDEPDGGGFPELMTGWMDLSPTISLATVNSFADLGYVINPDYAIENIANVAEPSTVAVFALGLMGLAMHRRKKTTL